MFHRDQQERDTAFCSTVKRDAGILASVGTERHAPDCLRQPLDPVRRILELEQSSEAGHRGRLAIASEDAAVGGRMRSRDLE
jgi:hypothetical protein